MGYNKDHPESYKIFINIFINDLDKVEEMLTELKDDANLDRIGILQKKLEKWPASNNINFSRDKFFTQEAKNNNNQYIGINEDIWLGETTQTKVLGIEVDNSQASQLLELKASQAVSQGFSLLKYIYCKNWGKLLQNKAITICKIQPLCIQEAKFFFLKKSFSPTTVTKWVSGWPDVALPTANGI